MARTRSKKNPMPPEGSWIKFQMDLRNIKMMDVARKANRSLSMVSEFVTGVKNSVAVGKALAQMLGFDNYNDMMEAAYRQSRGDAA